LIFNTEQKMSINNTSKNETLKNNCKHDIQLEKNKSLNKSYFYCYKCNNLILIYNNKIFCTDRIILKEIDENCNEKTEFDPVVVVKNMIRRQDEQIRDFNDKFNLNYSSLFNNENITENNNDNIDEKINETILTNNDDNIYEEKFENKAIRNLKTVSNQLLNAESSSTQRENKFTKIIFDENALEKYSTGRNQILIYIHKLCTKLKYNDNSFYMTLYLVDTFLSRIYSEEISEKDLFLVVLGFFLISSKYIEDDIFEPEFGIFCNIEKAIPLTIDEVRASEIQCLNLVNYNLYIYSVYDWLNMLLNNGITFENEVKDEKELEKIYLYTQKILTIITSKNYFYRYSSMQIAFSIVQISREKYINNESNLYETLYKKLISLYGVEFYDYEACYNEIKKDISECDEMEEDEEENEEINNLMNTKTNTNLNLGANTNSLEINMTSTNCKTLSKERGYDWETFTRKNRFRISKDSNKGNKFIKTDMNLMMNGNKISNKKKLISSPDQANSSSQKMKYKLKSKNNEHINNSIGILDNLSNNKKYSPNILSNTNNNSLNNTSVKSCNYNVQNQSKHLKIDCFRNEKDILLSDKNQRLNTNSLYINYVPKYFIKDNGQNLNYKNNISITNETINSLYNGKNKKKIQKNISSNTNTKFVYKINKNKNNEIKSSTNHYLKKTLFNLDNIVPTQLNYEYNINTINNNKVKKENSNSINKVQNIIVLNNNNINIYKNNFKNVEKLNNNKDKFKTHLLLDLANNQNNNLVGITTNKETKSFNKYTTKDYESLNRKLKKFKLNNGEIKIMNTNINMNINLNNNLKSRKITLNFKDILNKKLIDRQNNFLLKENKEINSKRFNSLNNNFYNAESSKNIKKNYEDENPIDVGNSHNFKQNASKKDGIENIFVKNKDFGKIATNIPNFKNITFNKPKLPKLMMNKNSNFPNK